MQHKYKATIFEKRIFKVFDDAKKYLENKAKDQKSKHWQKYNKRIYNLETLRNFRNNSQLSWGLDNQDVINFEIYFESIKKLSEKFIFKNFSKKNIGNANNLFRYRKCYIDFNKLIQLHWLKDLEKCLPNKNIKTVCEIGGGFGSFSELLIKNYNIKLLSIDLPEANLMTSYYLKKNFPKKKIYLYDNYNLKKKLTYNDFFKNDIVILPPGLNIDNKIKIDFFVNTRSFQEMNSNIIQNYFNFIHQHISKNGFFLNINRYEKASVGESIKLHKYPYDNNWKIIESKPSFNQEWVHSLMTKREFNNEKCNINYELKRIKKIGKKYYIGIFDRSKSYKYRVFLRILIKKSLGIKFSNFLGKTLVLIGEKLNNLK